MKQIKVISKKDTREIEPHGMYFFGTYFCWSGIEKIFGSRKKIKEISMQPFNGAIAVHVEDRLFKSKHGTYVGCSDHPRAILNMMGSKRKNENFRFYAKVKK